MNITPRVKAIAALEGRELDVRIAVALGLGNELAPYFSTSPRDALWLRQQMSRLGWTSSDQVTWMGWGDESKHPWGYSLWFKKWVNHVEYCSHHSHPDCSRMPYVTSVSALLALEATEECRMGPAGKA